MKIKQITLDSDTIHLKKDKFGWWRVVRPITNPDGSINLKNLFIGGSWVRFWIMIIIIIVFLGCLSEYSHAVEVANKCLEQTRIIIP